jgi:hypothetical protein
MFCNRCGTELPDGSQFCVKCGHALPAVTSEPPTLSTEGHQVSQQSNRWKKLAACALIALFSLMLVGSSAQFGRRPHGEGIAYALGALLGVLLILFGLYASIRWLLRLNGYTKTCGRQAVAYFFAVICGLGLLAAPFQLNELSTGLATLFVIRVALYIVASYACIRWIGSLRRKDKESAFAKASSAGG